jgi:spoIIIJ-associated protein
VTIEAKSLEQALVKAAGALGVTQDEMEYQVIKEESAKGLFSFFKNPVVAVKAWAKTPAGRTGRAGGQRGGRGRRDESRHEARPPRERPRRREDEDETAVAAEPLSPEQLEALQGELKEFCAGICAFIAGEPVNVSATVDDGRPARLVLNIDNEAIAQQIAKNSKLAEALEHILRKKPRHLRQELPFRIFVDVSGVRRRREDDLVQMAHDLSAKVHENKRPIVLNYKSSYDRKIIHMALDKDDRVYTKSIGSGPNRKLMILPASGAAAGVEPLETPTELE